MSSFVSSVRNAEPVSPRTTQAHGDAVPKDDAQLAMLRTHEHIADTVGQEAGTRFAAPQTT